MNLQTNQIIGFQNTTLDVRCLEGILWITWPDSHERILRPGQAATITSQGLICIQALAPAALRLSRAKKGFRGLGWALKWPWTGATRVLPVPPA